MNYTVRPFHLPSPATEEPVAVAQHPGWSLSWTGGAHGCQLSERVAKVLSESVVPF